MWIALASIVAAIIGVVATVSTNRSNEQSVQDTNEANLTAVRETNQSNVEQANLAYQRSLPINQVRNLMHAGMSRAGALASLTGGGTYTAPVLQSGTSQAAQYDYSGIAQAFERLGNVPANVEQNKLVQDQRRALEIETRIKENQELRAEEQHQYDMWLKTYGKRATMMIDSLSSDIVSQAADKNINLDTIDSTDKLVKEFDLGHNSDWLNMPASARSQVLEAVRAQAAENRARQQQVNANIAAKDKHLIDEQTLKRIKLEIQDFIDETDARKKEYAARKVRATAQQMADSYDLSMSVSHALEIFETDKNGNIKFDNNGLPVYRNNLIKDNEEGWSQVRDFWNKCFEVIPANILLRALSSVFK